MSGPATHAVHTVRVDGRSVRVLEHGQGPPVLLVHGLGIGADPWAPLLRRLGESGYHAIAPDLPGFGHSEGPRLGSDVPGMAAWLDRFAATLGIHRPAWVGHSIACQQLVRLAAAQPDRVAALVLAGPTGRMGRPALRQMAGLAVTAFRERPRTVRRAVRGYLRAPMATLATWVRALAHDTALDAPSVRAPTLLVTGEEDPVVSARFVDRLLRLLPDARQMRIEGAAHGVALDPVDPFADALLRFLARRYSRPITERWKSSGIASKSHGSPGT